jgi:hypothetical protein
MVSSMLVAAHILEHFEIWDAHEYPDRRVIEMREKEGRIPSDLSDFDDDVFDGYTNPLFAGNGCFGIVFDGIAGVEIIFEDSVCIGGYIQRKSAVALFSPVLAINQA